MEARFSDYDFAAALLNGIIVLDADLCIRWWNAEAERFFGLQIGQHENKKMTDVITDTEFHDYITQAHFHNSFEMPAPQVAGAHLLLKVRPYQNNYRLLIANDVTERHQLERMRQDFVANVSHELRTPLTVIKGYLEMLLEQTADDKPLKNVFEQIHQQTTRMETLIKDLLLLAHLETENPETEPSEIVAIAPLLEGICQDAVQLSGEQHHVIQAQLDENLRVYGHRHELHSAFANLIFNAVRYTPAGSTIMVKSFQDSQGMHVVVQDTGKGIDAKHIPRLTERFYRVDKGRSRRAGGTGLGLAIVKHVLIRHDAQLIIHSQVNKGSTFQCDFPRTRLAD